jgi:ADP-dependent NAD(P)H-hydrate dehydratase / NAD(P)H-hydrate epimerase
MSTIRRIDSSLGRQALFGVAATRRIESAAAGTAGPFVLMQRAGDAAARLALALAPHARRVLVFAGPGNNGGDGIVAATRLCAIGKAASVLLHGDAGKLPADAAWALARARSAGVRVERPAATDTGREDEPDLVIDALLGIGASRPPAAEIAAAIERIGALASHGTHVLAIDTPSGLDVDRGQPFGSHCVVAADTLSLLTLKPGLLTARGRDHAGRVWLDALGVDSSAEPADAWLVGRADALDAGEPRLQAVHKGSFGDVAVVGGALGMTGAALLAASAAHAAGAGRVFVDLLGSDGAAPGLDPSRPELMFRTAWWQGPIETLRASTVVCGCGGGDAVRDALPRLLSAVPRLVVDADGLNAIAADPALRAMTAARAARSLQTILTPHPLEAARLLGSSSDAVQADRIGAASEIAVRYGAIVVLKGSGSIIAAPGQPPCINATGNASLATAGTGDVLAGWIGGRWRSDASALAVATRGVIEHGAASEPERSGPLRATDLVEALYRASRTLT